MDAVRVRRGRRPHRPARAREDVARRCTAGSSAACEPLLERGDRARRSLPAPVRDGLRHGRRRAAVRRVSPHRRARPRPPGAALSGPSRLLRQTPAPGRTSRRSCPTRRRGRASGSIRAGISPAVFAAARRRDSSRATSIPRCCCWKAARSTGRLTGFSIRCARCRGRERRGWICGLGHGVLPGTPESSVRAFRAARAEHVAMSAVRSRRPLRRAGAALHELPAGAELARHAVAGAVARVRVERARRAARRRSRSTCISRSANRSARSAAATPSSRATTATRAPTSMRCSRSSTCIVERVPGIDRASAQPAAPRRRDAHVHERRLARSPDERPRDAARKARRGIRRIDRGRSAGHDRRRSSK